MFLDAEANDLLLFGGEFRAGEFDLAGIFLQGEQGPWSFGIIFRECEEESGPVDFARDVASVGLEKAFERVADPMFEDAVEPALEFLLAIPFEAFEGTVGFDECLLNEITGADLSANFPLEREVGDKEKIVSTAFEEFAKGLR
ncbi:MAG: hypothetical protein U0903_02245 [Planctomycetales bacterium]